MRNTTRAAAARFDVEGKAGAGMRDDRRSGPQQQEKKPQQADDYIKVLRRLDRRSASRSEMSVTPDDQYFIGVALRKTHLKLTRGSQTIFDGTMRAGMAYVQSPASRLCAQFDGTCDLLCLQIRAIEFRFWRSSVRSSMA